MHIYNGICNVILHLAICIIYVLAPRNNVDSSVTHKQSIPWSDIFHRSCLISVYLIFNRLRNGLNQGWIKYFIWKRRFNAPLRLNELKYTSLPWFRVSRADWVNCVIMVLSHAYVNIHHGACYTSQSAVAASLRYKHVITRAVRQSWVEKPFNPCLCGILF